MKQKLYAIANILIMIISLTGYSPREGQELSFLLLRRRWKTSNCIWKIGAKKRRKQKKEHKAEPIYIFYLTPKQQNEIYLNPSIVKNNKHSSRVGNHVQCRDLSPSLEDGSSTLKNHANRDRIQQRKHPYIAIIDRRWLSMLFCCWCPFCCSFWVSRFRKKIQLRKQTNKRAKAPQMAAVVMPRPGDHYNPCAPLGPGILVV